MRKVSIDGATLPSLKEYELLSKSYEFKLISPMFGGDTESFVINKKVPIRSQSIKGQLRFWWRTMQGESDSKRLLEREADLWGSATLKKKQSSIKVSVTGIKDLAFVKVEKKTNNKGFVVGVESNDIAPYVLFPVVNKVKNDEIVELLQQATFTLTITFPKECEKDAMNALLLWTLFGGVGGRTRRGCGSVYSQELLKDMQIDSLSKVKSFMERVAQGNSTELEYARLKGFKLYYSETSKDSVKSLQERYGNYRQARNHSESKHSGRSYWPEPDSIRNLFNQFPECHKPVHPDGIWFPRAIMGLPIMLEFRGEHKDDEVPGQISILPEESLSKDKKINRWPSIYYLKILRIGEHYYNVMLALSQKFPKGLIIKSKIGTKQIPLSAMPSNTQGKVMVKNPNNSSLELKGRTIYKALADALNLKEV